MKVVIELNSKNKKGKKYKIVVKPNDKKLGKIIFYEDDLFIDELWDKSLSLCHETAGKRKEKFVTDFEILDNKLDKILKENL